MSPEDQDVIKVMNTFIGFAENMLTKYGEFFPYGVVMSANGETSFVAGYEGSKRPLSQGIIDLLNAGFREGAHMA